MNITRRSLLQAIGLGSAVAVTGVSVANTKTSWEDVMKAAELMNAQSVPVENWTGIHIYEDGETVLGTDKNCYLVTGTSSGNLYKAIGTS